MCVLALVPNYFGSDRLPAIFLFNKACIFLLGIGTTVFHSMEYQKSRDSHMNLNVLDWLPISLSSATVLTMFLLDSAQKLSNTALELCFVAGLCWFTFLVIGMDTDIYTHLEVELKDSFEWKSVLNAALLLPLIVTLFAYSVAKLHWASAYVWALLVASVALWLVNNYVCAYWYPLAFFHGLYHVVITFALIEANCLAITLSGAWEVDSRSWWPIVRPKKEILQQDKKLFSLIIFPRP